MPECIHPLEATTRIRDDYARYLRTTFFIRDANLRDQFWRALDAPEFLVRGPILEASPPFKSGRSVADLIRDGVLDPAFERLCSNALPHTRPLYVHQDQAIEKVVAKNRNVVIATGTGSGKTEAFLLPIFDHLLRQQAAGVLDEPGVRALLLYPMNALANDQLKRLRRLLANVPEITFGRYTGETQETSSAAQSVYEEQFGGQTRLPNELLSREEMRAGPPHILITNYAMLEYLLLRPRDSEFFDGDAGRFWRFVVLDEAHVYDGASGIEIAMLLRRLKDRVVRSERGRLRCIATSATLGRGREDFPHVATFASELFGERFEYVWDDPLHQDVIEGAREDIFVGNESWGQGSAPLYGALGDCIDAGASCEELVRETLNHGVPEEVAQRALGATSAVTDPEDVASLYLWELLRGDGYLHALRDALHEPRMLSALGRDLGGAGLSSEAIVALVRLAVRARSGPESTSLLPARYHVFARALEGAYVCLNESHPAHRSEGKQRLFLSRHERCPHCGSIVFELATCRRCGTTYIVGSEEDESQGRRLMTVLRQPTAFGDDLLMGLSYFVLTDGVSAPDEDEAVVAGECLDALGEEQVEPHAVCLRCGTLSPDGAAKFTCDCPQGTPSATLHKVTTTHSSRSRKGTAAGDDLEYCVRCGASKRSATIFHFRTGADAPVSVLATSLYQMLPPDHGQEATTLPGQGRKLLTFSDSRQDAAYFAPYFERTYRQFLRRRLIVQALQSDEAAKSGTLRLDDITPRLMCLAEEAGVFEEAQSSDERTRKVNQWLALEFAAIDTRMSLEALGLLCLQPVRPDPWQPPAPLLEAPWNLEPREAFDLLAVLLSTLRYGGAVTFPDGVSPTDPVFEPRNVPVFMSEYGDDRLRVLGWRPKRGYNRRADFLARLLRERAGMAEEEARLTALDTLKEMWQELTHSASPWRSKLSPEHDKRRGMVYRLDHRFWEWKPALTATVSVYRCNRCLAISYVNLNGVCPAHGCDGKLERIQPDDANLRLDHYRHLYQTLEPAPLCAEEHTAQLTQHEAGMVQGRFVRGEVNLLSCSTTFELGVDVGDLQAVLMRNVPPTTANYLQRAGRAGRRTDSVALVVTFAQRRSHDLTHFNQPERLVAGRIRPPAVTVTNEKIVRRHCHSVLLAAFFRWAHDVHARDFRSVGPFFTPDDGQPSGPDLLGEYLAGRPREVEEALERIVPPEVRPVLGIPGWDWLPQLTADSGQGVLDLVTAEVLRDLDLYRQLEDEAREARNYREATHFEQVANTVLGRDLLGFLGNRNVLPSYGFPTNVVELRTRHLAVPEANKVELQRDLRLAISEYAPGGQVVAAKRVWTSSGLYRLHDRQWQPVYYAVCKSCGRFHRSSKEENGRECECGASLGSFRKFVKPEFGFVASREIGAVTERRPHRLYSSRAFFTEYAPDAPVEQEPYQPVPSLCCGSVDTTMRYSRHGQLAVVNSGKYKAGFLICTTCGWAEPAAGYFATKKPTRPQHHENPRTGRPCSGHLEPYDLGHEFGSDVLELRFRGAGASGHSDELWRSVLYALLEGATEVTGIPRDDLDGTLYPYQRGYAPALILFDNVPGGAGLVHRVAKDIKSVFAAALQRVQNCECGEETSCYECLRNYYNQYYHDQLRRGIARDFLQAVLGQ